VKKAILAVAVVLSMAGGAWGQTHQHQFAVIDGRTNPELISDDVAYEAVIGTMASASAEHQRAYFRNFKLSVTQVETGIGILRDFREAHEKLVQTYNEAAQRSQTMDRGAFNTFQIENTALLRNTQVKLESLIGTERFNLHIQGEKAHIQINKGGGQ